MSSTISPVIGSLSKTKLAAVSAFLAGLPLFAASVDPLPSNPLADRIRRSELVFDGTVIAIEHRNSDPIESGDRELPHTFVTYQVVETFRGRAPAANLITLRFLGGPNGKGRTLFVSGTPKFEIGDRDLLFVRDNTEDECPVVDGHSGRLRVVRGELFDDFGAELWLTPDGALASGAAAIDVSAPPYLPLDRSIPSQPIELVEERLPEGSSRIDADGMRAVLRELASRVASEATDPAPAPVKNADIGATFRHRLAMPDASR